jgi:hypothetical protein
VEQLEVELAAATAQAEQLQQQVAAAQAQAAALAADKAAAVAALSDGASAEVALVRHTGRPVAGCEVVLLVDHSGQVAKGIQLMAHMACRVKAHSGVWT